MSKLREAFEAWAVDDMLAFREKDGAWSFNSNLVAPVNLWRAYQAGAQSREGEAQDAADALELLIRRAHEALVWMESLPAADAPYTLCNGLRSAMSLVSTSKAFRGLPEPSKTCKLCGRTRADHAGVRHGFEA